MHTLKILSKNPNTHENKIHHKWGRGHRRKRTLAGWPLLPLPLAACKRLSALCILSSTSLQDPTSRSDHLLKYKHIWVLPFGIGRQAGHVFSILSWWSRGPVLPDFSCVNPCFHGKYKRDVLDLCQHGPNSLCLWDWKSHNHPTAGAPCPQLSLKIPWLGSVLWMIQASTVQFLWRWFGNF